MEFSGGLAGVLAEPAERSAVARRLASAALLDRDDLSARWRTICAHRRGDLAAEHASRRLERHRTDAVLERAGIRADAPTAAASDDLHEEIPAFVAPIEPPAVTPADQVEATALDLRAEIERRHRAVVHSEATLFEARRWTRARAVARHEAAAAEEKAALAAAGFDSYGSFLTALTRGERTIDLRAVPPLEAESSHQPADVAPAARVVVRNDRVENLRRHRAEQDRVLRELEAEIARLDRIHDADIDAIGPADLAGVIGSMLESYRSDCVLGGGLPIVLDGALDGLEPGARRTAVRALAAPRDVQSIVVTEDPQVMNSVTEAGGTIVLWSDAITAERGGSELQPSRRTSA